MWPNQRESTSRRFAAAPRHRRRALRHWLIAGAAIIAAACDSRNPSGPSSGPVTEPATDPALAVLVTSDIENFWAAYDAGGANGSASGFQTRYLDRASPGLKDFVASRKVTAADLAAMVRTFPRYFASIRASSLRLAMDATIQTRIRAGYRRIKDLYPPAVFPPVTFLIGKFSTGGTTSANGMLIGLEFYSTTPSTPLDELLSFQRDNVKPLDSLPVIIAHEHAHVLQARARGLLTHSNRTLLEQSVIEGGADFIGYQVTGGNINGRLWAYAIPREAELWAEFSAAMHGTDASRWLYNQGSATSDRPGDLGYFIGYCIAEAYYEKAADKAAALREIIDVSNADQFLAASGYSPK